MPLIAAAAAKSMERRPITTCGELQINEWD
jgi:hypothetical protein